jgi:hypothetical protein
VDNEDGQRLHVALPPFSFWLALPLWSVREDREVDVSIHNATIWWSIWRDPMGEWSRKVPRWREGNWCPVDTFLGRHKYTSHELSTRSVVIPMPEGSYLATVKLTRDVWKRPRWPFAREVFRATIDVPTGIPHEGKGENAWDCGKDALYGLTCRAATVDQAIARTVERVLASRRKYDGDVMAAYPPPPQTQVTA